MTATHIVQYDEVRAKMDEIRAKADFLPDVTTDEGYEKSKRIALDIGKVCTSLDKARKELKAESLEYGRKVDNEANVIATELRGLQGPHREAYKSIDEAKKNRELERRAGLEARIQEMRGLPEAMRDSHSSEIKEAFEATKSNECLDFYEFSTQALLARNTAADELAKMYAATLKREEDALELAELRKQQAKADAAKAKQNQVEREAEIARNAAAFAEEALKVAQQNARMAAEQAELDKVAAVEEGRRKAEQEAKRVEQKRLEVEAHILAADKKRAANLKHKAEANRLALESLHNEVAGLTDALTIEQGKAVITVIAKGLVPGMFIKY